MNDGRMVWMTEAQAREIDRHIEELMREHEDARASTMMTLALAFKFAPEPERPSNVVEFRSREHSVRV